MFVYISRIFNARVCSAVINGKIAREVIKVGDRLEVCVTLHSAGGLYRVFAVVLGLSS